MGQSPVFPAVVATVDFGTAMKNVLEGMRVQRMAWPNKKVYLFVSESDRLMIRTEAGAIADVLLNRADMEAVDWVVVQPTLQ